MTYLTWLLLSARGDSFKHFLPEFSFSIKELDFIEEEHILKQQKYDATDRFQVEFFVCFFKCPQIMKRAV